MAIVIILDIITILVFGGIIAIAPLIKKVTNNYFFWFTLASLLFVYEVIFRFGPDWMRMAQYGNDGSTITSKAMLLDICPFTSVFLLISLIVDPSRRMAKIAAPFAIFGGLITILGGGSDMLRMIDDAHGNIVTFIFKGSISNELYFMMHFLMIAIGTLVFVSTPKTHITDWFYCNGFAAIYYSYVAICMTQLNVQNNVSGLCSQDWTIGEYAGIASIFSIPHNLIMPLAPIIGYTASYVCISGLIYLQSLLQKINKHYKYSFAWYRNVHTSWKKRLLIGWYDLNPKHPILYKKFFTINKHTW